MAGEFSIMGFLRIPRVIAFLNKLSHVFEETSQLAALNSDRAKHENDALTADTDPLRHISDSIPLGSNVLVGLRHVRPLLPLYRSSQDRPR